MWGFSVWPLFCYAVLNSFAIILMGKRELIVFLTVILLSGVCKCSVALLRGAVCWYAVCDCGISESYSLVSLYSLLDTSSILEIEKLSI